MKRLRWIFPAAGLFVLLTCWQQQTFEVRPDCSYCHGRGKVPMPKIPEDLEFHWEECTYCGPLTRERVQRWVRTVGRALPDTPFAAWAGLSGLVLAVLVYGLRQVPDEGKARWTLLDRWMNP